jgi:predicted nucleic acid-binding protein
MTGSPGEKRAFPPVLIDTPVWRDYFHKEGRTFQTVNKLMDAGRVCCVNLVVAELLETARSAKEMKVFQDFTRIFPILDEPPGAWVEAARLSFHVRQKGKALPLRDCYLGHMAKVHGALLYTTHQGLHRARQVFGSGLKFFSERNLAG